MHPRLYNRDGKLLASMDNIIKDTAGIKRVVNGEFTFSFEAFEKELKSEYFDTNNYIIIDDQAFDIKYIEQKHDIDIKYKIQCEHVNYRMNDGEENLYSAYGFLGTPTEILTNILSGTEFSVGTVEYTDSLGLVVNSEITRKALIYQLANLLGGEIEYTNKGFTINILNTIGKDNGFQVRFGKNLKSVSKIIDSRGGLKTSYSVDLVELKNSNEYIEKNLQDLETIGVGDTIRIIDEVIGLDVQNRVYSIEYNPIFSINTKLEIANTIELISDKINQIDTSTIHQGRIYNGIRISPEEGFISERSDGKSQTSMNSTDGIYIKSDTGSGLIPVFYVDVNGRVKAKQIDIDGSGTFGGEVNIQNGFTNIRLAPTGDNPLNISYGGIPIFFIDSGGSGTFKGKVTGSEINASKFASEWSHGITKIGLYIDETEFRASEMSEGDGTIRVGRFGPNYLSLYDFIYGERMNIGTSEIDIDTPSGHLLILNSSLFQYNGYNVLHTGNYIDYLNQAGYVTDQEVTANIAASNDLIRQWAYATFQPITPA